MKNQAKIEAVNIEKVSPVYWHDKTGQRLRIIEVRSNGVCLTQNNKGDNILVVIKELKTVY